MEHNLRRHEFGKMLLDVAKYVLTIVVVGGVFSGTFRPLFVGCGAALGLMIAVVGCLAIPADKGDA